MKKILFVALFVFGCITDCMAERIDICCFDRAPADGEGMCREITSDEHCDDKDKGCPDGYEFMMTYCETCPIGSYCYNRVKYDCSQPNNFPDVTFTEDGQTGDQCPWKISCNTGQYWTGNGCESCGIYDEHYVGNGITYSCNGEGSNNTCEATSPGSYCTGATYTINLDKNMPYTHAPDYDKYMNKELSYKYEAGYQNGSSNWNTTTVESSDFKQPTHNYLEFTGYYTKASDGDLVIDADGKISESYQGSAIEAFIGGTSTLYAQYKVNEIEITYKNTNGYTKSQTFDIGDDSNSTNRKVIDIITGWTPAGQKFKHWECTAGCDAGKIYEADDVFEFTEELDRTLTARYEDCPAGHYCYGNTEYDCPGGSTSDAGSSKIQDCYMFAKTTFTDGTGANFTLGELLGDDNAKIYRH